MGATIVIFFLFTLFILYKCFCTLHCQFRRKGPNEKGLISEAEFAELLLAYGGYPTNKKARMLKRVKKAFKVRSNISCTTVYASYLRLAFMYYQINNYIKMESILMQSGIYNIINNGIQ